LSNEDATALAMLLGTVSLQHDNYLPWWRENTASSVEQPSRSKTVFAGESDGNASDTDDDNDNAGEFCSGDYYKWAEATMDHMWKTSTHRWQLSLPKASKP